MSTLNAARAAGAYLPTTKTKNRVMPSNQPTQPHAFNVEEVSRAFIFAIDLLWNRGFHSEGNILNDAGNRTLAEITRLRPFESRCHEIDLAEQRLAARTREDAEMGLERQLVETREAEIVAEEDTTAGGGDIQPQLKQPLAHYLSSLLFCGRQVFWVEGHPGLWGTGPYASEDGKRLLCHVAVALSGRGYLASETKMLYQLAKISAEVAKAFRHSAEPDPENKETT